MEIIKGYCCHSKEVCSWPSFLSLLSKVNRLKRTARITKRSSFLTWIPPPPQLLCSLLHSQVSWILRTSVLEELYHSKLFIFNPSSPFSFSASDRRWDLQRELTSTNDQMLAVWNCNSGAYRGPVWQTGACGAAALAAEPSATLWALTQGIPKKRGQPHHKLHFKG